MEASDANVRAKSGTEEQKHLTASDEAITFMSSIEPAELQRCVFSESLAVMSENGSDLGTFSVSVEFSRRAQQPCVLLHAQSQGVIDGCPCGTTVTAYISVDLEVLEEDYHEYVELEGHSVDKKCYLVQHDGQMVISRVTAVGQEETKESVCYPMNALRGLVTEGSSLLMMRLMALRKKLPKNMSFVSLDQRLQTSHTTFNELGLKQLEVGGEVLEGFGVQRTVHCGEDIPVAWQCYLLDDGHLVSRMQVGSPVTMKLVQLPPKTEKNFQKIPLAWEEDLQMVSEFSDRKEELKADHTSYLRQHPEIRALLSDFLLSLLLRKPNNVFQFAREYFLPFAPRRSPQPNLNAQAQ
uniref:Ciliogenesis-associated TTC17-interacting protein n=1 Tax=Nothobranchius korthausae TaxID=1143690 RepID=A0A1A8FKA6_9TELE